MAAPPAAMQANVGMCCDWNDIFYSAPGSSTQVTVPKLNWKITGVASSISLAPNDWRYRVVENKGAGPAVHIIFPHRITRFFPCVPAAATPTPVVPAAAQSGGRKKRKQSKRRKHRKASKRTQKH